MLRQWYIVTVNYRVVLKSSEEGWAVWVPGLPGCASQGKTEEDALENIKDAIRDYLSVLADVQREAGITTRTVTVDFA